MKLLVQYANNKFINNIANTDIGDIAIDTVNVSGNLYQMYYNRHWSHAIFVESIVTNEILQFVSEFFQTVKIYIYHDKTPNIDFIKTYGSSIKHLVRETVKSDLCKKVPNLLNKQIFYDKNQQKDDSIICFLDNIPNDVVIEKLKNVLYPATKSKIKLFNSSSLKHHQNLGHLSEKDRAYVLQKSLAYIPISDEYLPEAVACGCQILDTNLNQIKIDNNYLSDYISYDTYIKELING